MENEQIQKCIEACLKAMVACEHCSAHDLMDEGENAEQMKRCIRINRDCADVCSLTARLLARHSEHGMHLMKECMELCEKCAQECEQHEHQHCKECAAACRACLEECRKMTV